MGKPVLLQQFGLSNEIKGFSKGRRLFMAEFDWHAERSDLPSLRQLDREPEGTDIDMQAVQLYRLESVRRG